MVRSESKVWLVTRGQYSDYDVVAVFSTQEEAERFCSTDSATGYDKLSIEEEPLYEKVEDFIGRKVFFVQMTQDGETVRCQDLDEVAEPGFFFERAEIDKWIGRQGVPFLSGRVQTRDRTQAIKVANEMRAMLIASDAWPKEIPEGVCFVEIPR